MARRTGSYNSMSESLRYKIIKKIIFWSKWMVLVGEVASFEAGCLNDNSIRARFRFIRATLTKRLTKHGVAQWKHSFSYQATLGSNLGTDKRIFISIRNRVSLNRSLDNVHLENGNENE